MKIMIMQDHSYYLFQFISYDGSGQDIKRPVILGEPWSDTDGNLINAHGAGLLLFGDTYYMFGKLKRHHPPGTRSELGGLSCSCRRCFLLFIKGSSTLEI